MLLRRCNVLAFSCQALGDMVTETNIHNYSKDICYCLAKRNSPYAYDSLYLGLVTIF
jgi:hypothetical protein